MSLIRLLTTTRSLRDVKNEPSPYRMSEQGLLPKFGPKKRAGATRETAREYTRPTVERQTVREGARPPGEGAGDGKENLGEGTGDRTDAGCSLKSESSRKPQGNAERGTRNAESGWLRGWWQKLFRRRPRREYREPVQAEFGLDLVRVVRNDLSDADSDTPQKPEKNKPKVADQPVEESVFGATRG